MPSFTGTGTTWPGAALPCTLPPPCPLGVPLYVDVYRCHSRTQGPLPLPLCFHMHFNSHTCSYTFTQRCTHTETLCTHEDLYALPWMCAHLHILIRIYNFYMDQLLGCSQMGSSLAMDGRIWCVHSASSSQKVLPCSEPPSPPSGSLHTHLFLL